ncbi:MAG: VPLPA-CTERM sorting domain-containing protein [Candidatus Methylumidiphilus sp.]
MKTQKMYYAVFSCLCAFNAATQAATMSFDTGQLLISFDTDAIVNLGVPVIQGNSLVFTPTLQLDAPADQISYYDYQSYAAVIDIEAKPGFQIEGYALTASGPRYTGDDAHTGINGTFNQEFYGASYDPNAPSSTAPWSANQYFIGATLPSVSGDIFVQTENHYSYEDIVGSYETPIYEWVYQDVLVRYDLVYDEFGTLIEIPVFESQYVEQLTGYTTEYLYGTFYQTSGGSFGFDRMTITVDAVPTSTPVPLPSAGLLLMSALLAGGAIGRRRSVKPQNS